MLLFRANIAHFPHATVNFGDDIQVIQDGGLVVEGGKIVAIGDYAQMRRTYPDAELNDHSGCWILPGLIDSHLHYPQTQSIASYGDQLLSWLENYTFPTEMQFSDLSHAQKVASVFLQQLVKNGTTTGLVFSTVHKEACDALFTAASQLDMALIAGKVCMDRNCPEELQDCPTSAQKDSAALIDHWHNRGRNRYAITPRFAPTSTEAQMASLGELAQQYQDVYIQTHLSENVDEINWVKSLYPNATGYLDVYDQYHMVRERAVFGHCVHLTNDEWQRMADTGATVAFCPSSNLFLGSGLFDNAIAKQYKVPVALATDVGAGTSFSMFSTYGEAYKISQLNKQPICPLEGFYMMTQGAAIAHQWDDHIGNLNSGTAADFIIVSPRYCELTSLRIEEHASFSDMFFALSILGAQRAVKQTWISGRCCYENKENNHAMA